MLKRFSNICCTCLSTDRKLSRLTDIDEGVTNLFFLLSCDPEAYEELCNKEVAYMSICWECRALIKRMCKFRDQACTAQKQLNNIVNRKKLPTIDNSLSVLSKFHQDTYNYVYISNDAQAPKEEDDTSSTKSDSNFEIQNIYYDTGNDENCESIEDIDIHTTNINNINNITIDARNSNQEKKVIERNPNYTIKHMTQVEMLDSMERRRSAASFIEAKFKCDTCLEVFDDNEKRKMHYEEAHIKKLKHSKCHICEAYISDRLFGEHLSDHYLKFECHFCDYVCYNLLIMMKHVRVGHSIRNTPKELRRLKKISIRKNPGLKPWLVDVPEDASIGVVCSHCLQIFESKKERALHIKKVHKQPVHQCGKCGKCFTAAASLMKHERLHEAKGQQKLHSKEKPRSEALETKTTDQADTNIVYKCTICDADFSSVDNLKKHKKLHNGLVQDLFKDACPVCGKMVGSDNMKVHMLTHDEREPTTCYECNKTFVSKAGYEFHIKHTKTHAGIDAFNLKCPICPRSFRCKSERRDHVDFWHNGIVTYKCDICFKILSSRRLLLRHMRIVHSGTTKKKRPRKMYLCQTCGKACRDIAAFKEHEALHTGEKLFSCKPCNRSYRTNTSLYLHKRRYHIDSLYLRYPHLHNDDDDDKNNDDDNKNINLTDHNYDGDIKK